MNKTYSLRYASFSWYSLVFVFLAVLIAAFLLLSDRASAADAGEFVHFRIDSELNVLIANKGTLTVRWYCDGASTFGQVNDNTSSESTQAADGIVKVASASKEMTDASCTIGASETLRASVSIDGWVEREWTAASFPGASTSDPFATGASMDYTIVINGVDDELGTAITLDGTSASASYSGTVASQSYSGGKRYVAGSTSGGTVRAESDGYVTRTSSALTISGTASQSVDFGTGDDSDLDESGLSFALKAQVYEGGGDFDNYKLTSGVVTAGDSLGTTCTAGTGSNAGYWYCAIPLADTETTAQFSRDGWVTTTATYTDRTDEDDAQVTTTILPTQRSSGGSCASCAPTEPVEAAESTPTPTPTPTPSLRPTVTPAATPVTTPVVGPVKLYRKVADPKVYVQGADGLLTWVRTLEQFNAAGYRWSDVQVLTGPEFAQLRIAPSSMPAKLFRKANDPKVYVQGADGTLTWVKTLEQFNAAGYSWSDVQVISGEEFGKMRVSGQIRVVKDIDFLRVRGGPSTSNAILGQVSPGQVLQFYEWNNGWYKIKRTDGSFGWVYGGYADEI